MRGFFSILGVYKTKSMAVQQEIKSQLAKLLATEDIVVEHKHVETAQFNVDTRVLILPLWEKASNYVYDMLVGHEVGHALFTPCLLYTSPSPRDRTRSRMPSSA